MTWLDLYSEAVIPHLTWWSSYSTHLCYVYSYLQCERCKNEWRENIDSSRKAPILLHSSLFPDSHFHCRVNIHDFYYVIVCFDQICLWSSIDHHPLLPPLPPIHHHPITLISPSFSHRKFNDRSRVSMRGKRVIPWTLNDQPPEIVEREGECMGWWESRDEQTKGIEYKRSQTVIIRSLFPVSIAHFSPHFHISSHFRTHSELLPDAMWNRPILFVLQYWPLTVFLQYSW